MKSTDKVLIAIVAGIILLIIVAFVVALAKPEPTYQAEDTPEGVAYNYLLALQRKNMNALMVIYLRSSRATRRPWRHLSSMSTMMPGVFALIITMRQRYPLSRQTLPGIMQLLQCAKLAFEAAIYLTAVNPLLHLIWNYVWRVEGGKLQTQIIIFPGVGIWVRANR